MGGNKGKVKPRDKPKPKTIPCAGCVLLGKKTPTLLDDDSLCSGCGKHICDSCDIHMPWGDHRLEDHWEDEDVD